jgi:Ribonuclease G/E
VTDQTEPEQPDTEERDPADDARPATSRTRTRRRSRSGAGASSRTEDRAEEAPRDTGDGDADRGPEERPRGGRGRQRAGGATETDDRDRGAADADGAEDQGDDDEARDGGDGKRRRRRGRRGRGGKGRGKGRGRGGDQGGDRSRDRGGSQERLDPAAEGSATDADADGGAAAAEDATGQPGTDAPGSGSEATSDDTDEGGDRGGNGSGGRGSTKGPGKGAGGKGGSARASGRGGAAKGAGEGSGRGGSAEGSGRSGADDEDSVEAAIAKGGTRMAAKRGRRGNGNGRGGRQQRPGGVPEEVRRAILEGPPRTMLVTAREDRTQIAVLEDRTVVEHYVTRKEDVTYVGNIYMARVQNVLPGMEAAFLDIGKGRNGVLYAGEVLYDELDLEEGEDERIENALKPGQKVLVQVTKDPMGSKGPRLTMHLSLAGRYMVLAPNSDLFGISRKLTDRERDRLRKVVKRVKPTEHGVIVRTAAEGATDDQITADLERLLAKWQRVEEAAAGAKALTTVYEEPPLVVKVIRDNFGPEFERCIVDDEDLYHQVRGYLGEVAPELLGKVELYGQPTTDVRSKAVGAPSADGNSAADDAPADATGDGAGADDPAAGAGGEVVAADPAADRAAVVSTKDGGSDAAVDAGDGGDAAEGAGPDDGAEGAGPDEAAEDAGPDEAAEDAGRADDDAEAGHGGLNDRQLEEARTRRAELPPLFDAYDVADQLRKAMGKKVWLPSGGYLIIEATEAMKVIDVNTGKFTGSGDSNLEEVVLKTNLEAADEIVRQLRLRDMGGIIIIDFIDMLLRSNQEQVVRRLKRELLRDRTKTRVSEVSKLGLVQMTRKNVSQGLIESFSHTCPECEGRGLISELG